MENKLVDTESLEKDIVSQALQEGLALALTAAGTSAYNKNRPILAKAVPLLKYSGPVSFAVNVPSAYEDAKNADSLYEYNTGLAEKAAAFTGSMANGLSFGAIPAGKAALGLVPRKIMTKEERDNYLDKVNNQKITKQLRID